MIRFLLTVLLTASVVPALAQTKNIDSLRVVLRNHPQADTFRVNRLIDLTFLRDSLIFPNYRPGA